MKSTFIKLFEQQLNGGSFHFLYQPIVDQQGKLYSLEALLRFSAYFDMDDLIHLLEKYNHMPNITTPVFDLLIQDMKRLQLLGYSLPIAFNMTSSQLSVKGVAREMIKKMKEQAIPTTMLIIEITEHALMKQSEDFLENLDYFNGEGIPVRLDDFGRGYSSLTSLQSLDLHGIKLDKQFIHQMDHENLSFSIVQSVQLIADKHNFMVIAEGIEREEQFAMLQSLGVQYYQGFLFGKPMGLHKIIERIEGEWN